MKNKYKNIAHCLLWAMCWFVNIQLHAADPVSVMAISRGGVLVGLNDANAKALLMIDNQSRTPVNDIDYAIVVGSEESKTIHYTFKEPLRRNYTQMIEVEIPPAKEIGVSEVSVYIKNANGTPNGYSNPYATVQRTTLSKLEKRKVVMEEYSAMWCHWCPKAVAAIDHLAKHYPNDFIGIAVHGDALACGDYVALQSKNRGIPNIVVNRLYTDKAIIVGSSDAEEKFVAKQNFINEQKKGAKALVEVKAVWDKERKNINVTTETTFRLNDETNTYALAYVILANGLYNSTWRQANNYYGDTSYKGIIPEMDVYVDGGTDVGGLHYDNIPVRAEGINNGIAGSISTPIVVDKTQTHSYTFTNVGSDWKLKNKEKVQVCALLIDTKTNEIVNADKTSVLLNVDTGIDNNSVDATQKQEVARYNVNGELLAAPVKGINIVKFNDGSVKKVVVE